MLMILFVVTNSPKVSPLTFWLKDLEWHETKQKTSITRWRQTTRLIVMCANRKTPLGLCFVQTCTSMSLSVGGSDLMSAVQYDACII